MSICVGSMNMSYKLELDCCDVLDCVTGLDCCDELDCCDGLDWVRNGEGNGSDGLTSLKTVTRSHNLGGGALSMTTTWRCFVLSRIAGDRHVATTTVLFAVVCARFPMLATDGESEKHRHAA